VHFKWLQTYALDGVMVQRFCGEIADQNGVTFTQRNRVTQNVRSSAEKYGRTFNIMYDVSGFSGPGTLLSMFQRDWQYLVNTLQVTKSPMYQHHNGKPVVSIFGIGFTEHPPENVVDAVAVINWFKNTANVYLIGSVPYWWRTGTHDSRAGFINAYNAFDSLNPWAVGRYANADSFNPLLESVVKPDKVYTDQLKIGYAPIAFPGFSWANLQELPQNFNQIPRNGGQFFTMQTSAYTPLKPQFIYIAMFDEVNEGTAMFKAVSLKSQTPSDATFLYLNVDGKDVPSDHYLQLASQVKW